MDSTDVRTRIKQCMGLLEGYRGFSPMVDDAIETLRMIDDCVAEPTPRKMEESRRRLAELTEAIDPYRGYVPLLAETLDELVRWFE